MRRLLILLSHLEVVCAVRWPAFLLLLVRLNDGRHSRAVRAVGQVSRADYSVLDLLIERRKRLLKFFTSHGSYGILLLVIFDLAAGKIEHLRFQHLLVLLCFYSINFRLCHLRRASWRNSDHLRIVISNSHLFFSR